MGEQLKNCPAVRSVSLTDIASDNQDIRKRDISRKYMAYLSEDEEYALSSQVLNEFCNVAFKKLKPLRGIVNILLPQIKAY